MAKWNAGSIALIVGAWSSLIFLILGVASQAWFVGAGGYWGLWQLCSPRECIRLSLDPLYAASWFTAIRSLMVLSVISSIVVAIASIIHPFKTLGRMALVSMMVISGIGGIFGIAGASCFVSQFPPGFTPFGYGVYTSFCGSILACANIAFLVWVSLERKDQISGSRF